MEGNVKWFNRQKGYGFIQGEDDKEYFVHYSALAEGTFIRDNDIVAFEAAETDKGIQAKNVTLVKKASDIEAEGGDASAEESAPADEPEDEPASEEEAPVEEEKTEDEPAEEEAPVEEEPAEEEKKEE